MSTAICLLGRTGDCINLLPCAKHIYDSTGEKPFWVVSKTYLLTLLGCDYLIPDAVHFSIHKTQHAMEYAQAKYDNVLNGNAWGKSWKGRRDAAFNYLSWENIGYGKHFEDTEGFPLVFDKRDVERENFLVTRHIQGTRPLILTCLGCSKSSPFHHHQQLQDIIVRKWGQSCQIINLCGVKAARIYDLLALFDRASCLVTTDTAALHLATATPDLAVVALLNDNPFLATRPRCKVLFSTHYALALQHVSDIHAGIFSGLQQARERRRNKTEPEPSLAGEC